MADDRPAVALAAVPGRRQRTLALAREIERRGFAGISLFGSVREVRDGVEAWREAGVRTPILVPSSAAGNQLVAFAELFAAYA